LQLLLPHERLHHDLVPRRVALAVESRLDGVSDSRAPDLRVRLVVLLALELALETLGDDAARFLAAKSNEGQQETRRMSAIIAVERNMLGCAYVSSSVGVMMYVGMTTLMICELRPDATSRSAMSPLCEEVFSMAGLEVRLMSQWRD
jgi:hypothetical protein